MKFEELWEKFADKLLESGLNRAVFEAFYDAGFQEGLRSTDAPIELSEEHKRTIKAIVASNKKRRFI